MSDPTKPDLNPAPRRPVSTVPVASRRRLLQGGLASAPVLMTLISRPVLGQVQTPSAFCSGNTSTPLASALLSSGRSATFWKEGQNFSVWPAPFYPTTVQGPGGHHATLFDSVFTPHFSGKTLLQVLDEGGGPPHDVARDIVAALLNIAAGWTPVLTIPVVKGIWSEYITTGSFEPTAGIHWDHGQIVTYLQSTMSA